MVQTQIVERDKARVVYVAGSLYTAADIPEADDWVSQGIAEDPDAPKTEPGGEVAGPAPVEVGPDEVVQPLGESLAGPAESAGEPGPADEGSDD